MKKEKLLRSDSRRNIFASRFFRFLNRFAPYVELVLTYYVVDYQIRTTFADKSMAFLLYALPIIMLVRLIRWEWRCLQSRSVIKETALNKRVQGFSGFQGCGKTSFMLYTAYVLNSPHVFSNFPCKVRGKFAHQLTRPILDCDERVPEKSTLLQSEVTMLFHNLVNGAKNKEEALKLYGQQLLQQIVRHAFDGFMFYDSVDLSRLPQMLKDNIGLTNYMLGQGSATLSFIITPILALLAKPFGVELKGSVRYWDLQQFERIPESGYVFDLSTQEKTQDNKHYANLLRVCTWDSIQRFDYDDRFLRGLYAMLPEHVAKDWDTLIFDNDALRAIGYGFLLDFFEQKAQKKYYASLGGIH